MTHEYLKDHIVEELNGAVDYMEKAIECKKTMWGSKFYTMAEMEIEHANCMLKMFNATEKSNKTTDSEYASMYKAILESYSTVMGKYEHLKKLYWKE